MGSGVIVRWIGLIELKCQENFKNINFYAVVKDTKKIVLLETATKISYPVKRYVSLFNAETFSVPE